MSDETRNARRDDARAESGATDATATQSGAGIRLSSDEVLFFNRQLASMARLNMPIAKGLRILARDVQSPGFKALLEGVQHDLDEGRSLLEALSKHPESFSRLQLEIVRAGEATGNLAVILEELNSHSEAMRRVKGRIVEAVTYPAVISAIIFLFLLFFLVFVAPEFEDMLDKRKSAVGKVEEARPEASDEPDPHQLPMTTRALFAVSGVVSVRVAGVPVVMLLIIAGTIAGSAWVIRRMSRLGEEYDDVLFNIPLFNKLFASAALMKVTRTMRDLLRNGVSMVETLRLSSTTVGRNRIAYKLEELRAAVEEGGSFSRNLSGDVFPDTMVWKLQMAEEKGIVEEALGELSQEFEQAVDRQTTILTKFLAPLLLVLMGGVVFVLFLACFVPLTTMYRG